MLPVMSEGKLDILGLFCKVPTGDSTDWLMLPYGARGLLLQLWRKVGHDGRLELGRHGLRGVTGHVGSLADWPAIEVDLKALLDAGAVIHHADTGQLELVGYVEHQGAYARTKAAERMRRKREQKANASEPKGTDANKSEHVRTSSTEEIKKEIREDPPKSPKGDNRVSGSTNSPLPAGFWLRFVERAGKEWGLPEKLSKRCQAQGFVLPGTEQALLFQGALEAQSAGFTEQDFMRLADFIAAGGVSWRGAAWQQVAKNFLAELSKALAWDGVSDPRQRSPARAPRMMGEERHQEEARIADEQASDTAYIRAQLEEARADAAAREEEERQKRHGRRDE